MIVRPLHGISSKKVKFTQKKSDDDFQRVVADMPENHYLKRLARKNKNCFFKLSADEQLDLTNRAVFVIPEFVRSLLSLSVKKKADMIYWMSEPIRELLIGFRSIMNRIVLIIQFVTTTTIYWKTVFLDIVFQISNHNRQLEDHSVVMNLDDGSMAIDESKNEETKS